MSTTIFIKLCFEIPCLYISLPLRPPFRSESKFQVLAFKVFIIKNLIFWTFSGWRPIDVHWLKTLINLQFPDVGIPWFLTLLFINGGLTRRHAFSAKAIYCFKSFSLVNRINNSSALATLPYINSKRLVVVGTTWWRFLWVQWSEAGGVGCWWQISINRFSFYHCIINSHLASKVLLHFSQVYQNPVNCL
jgi:hypothetical protein